jgi:hypothetical protein
MTELSLLEKLRLAHVTTGQRMFEEAAERIEALEAALKPFADQACLSDELPDTYRIFVYVSDLRQARKVLGEKQ